MDRLLIKRKVRTGCFAFVLLTVFVACAKDKVKSNDWGIKSIRVHADSAEREYNGDSFSNLHFFEQDKQQYCSFRTTYQTVFCSVKMGNSKIEFKEFKTTTMFSEGSPEWECYMLMINLVNHYKIYKGEGTERYRDFLDLMGDNGEKIKLQRMGDY